MRKFLISLFGIYLLGLASCWVWFAPRFVDQRIAPKIKPGVSGMQVAAALGIHGPMDMPEATYCAPTTMEKFKRISVYNIGGVPLLPFPMGYETSTDFCFDAADRLVAFHTQRWIDAP
jgi:hypothetical protein